MENQVVNLLDQAEQAKLKANWKATIERCIDEDLENLCSQITLTILEYIVLHILVTRESKNEGKRKKMLKHARHTEIYRCFKKMVRMLFPEDNKLQINLAKSLTKIVEEVLSLKKEQRMKVLDTYLGKYVKSTWRSFDQKKSVNLKLLKHYLNASSMEFLDVNLPFLATKTVKYHEKGEPFRPPKEVKVIILKVCPSETTDPDTDEHFIKSLIFFKCPECEKTGRINYVLSEYDLQYPFFYSRFIEPLPTCQERHSYWMERALYTMHLHI